LQIVVAFPYQRIGHYQDQKATWNFHKWS
jgi:hypothetical protein